MEPRAAGLPRPRRARSPLPVFSLLLVLALQAAGCLDALAAGCAPGRPPPATLGSAFTYAGEGSFSSLAAEVPMVDESLLGSGGSQRFLVPGSQVTIAVAGAPATRLAAGNDDAPAVQASYRLWQPGMAAPLPFLDEWVDPASSQPVQVVHRNILAGPGALAMHQVRLTRFDRPPLLMAPLFWPGGPVEPAQPAARFAYPAERTGPSAGGTEGWFEVTSAGVARGGKCLLEARITVEYPPMGEARFPQAEYRLSFAPGVPLPERVEFHFSTPESRWDMTLDLVSWSAGGGPALAPFGPGEAPAVRRERSAPGTGILPGEPTAFPTGFAQAVRVAHGDAAAAAWLDQHPAALPFYAQHVLGAPGSGVADEWRFRMADGGDAREFSVVALEGQPAPALGGGYRVFVKDAEAPAAVPDSPRITWGELERLHRAAYGVPMEVAIVDLAKDFVALGTHEGTAQPRAGAGGGATFIHTGLLLSASDGMLLQEDSLVEAPIGPPVGPAPANG